MTNEVVFTVCTPTYNRDQTLHRVYESLMRQTFDSFEWIIVDDGSTDDTSGLVSSWQTDTKTWFPIRYFYQTNQHKKTAHNHGVKEAYGEFFLLVDSDDSFAPDTLNIFFSYWLSIPKDERHYFAGVGAHCQYENQKMIGDRFPAKDWIDSNFQEIRYRYKVKGDKWWFNRTAILRKYPFPENIPGFVPESVVWSKIGAKYKTRFINRVLLTVHRDTAGGKIRLTDSKNPKRWARGYLYWKRVILTDEIDWFKYKPISFLLDAARLMRFRLHLSWRYPAPDGFWPSSVLGSAITLLMAPVGVMWWLTDKMRRI